ncbi:MAG TPA: hypothetical protein VJB60_05035 [Candidatus Peribacterales bacterium]|nr:hypothetical protein [Candidatus Peribacterales bacterium]
MKKSLLLIVLSILLLGGEQLHAEEGSLLLPAEHAYSNEEALASFVRLLKPTPEHDIYFDPIKADQLNEGSHLRIFYQSKNPVPVEFGPLGMVAGDILSAVLPPAEQGDVLLPLAPSPSWRAGAKGIFLKVYGKIGEESRIQKLRVENHLSIFQRFVSYIHQPFSPERFTYSTMSELAGYRMGGASLAVLIGILIGFIIVLLIAIPFFRQQRKFPSQHIILRNAFLTCLCFLFLYEARFLIDLTAYTVRLEREWFTEGRLGHAGDIYQIADAVLERVAEKRDTPVLLCNPEIATPLRYLIYPTPLLSPEELVNTTSALAITNRVWDPSTKSFQCTDFRFDGTVIRLFRDGAVLAGPPSDL